MTHGLNLGKNGIHTRVETLHDTIKQRSTVGTTLYDSMLNFGNEKVNQYHDISITTLTSSASEELIFSFSSPVLLSMPPFLSR